MTREEKLKNAKKDNRPNFIAHTASKISNLLEIDENKLSEITIKNSRELLKR